jgi:hypothetical protein
LDDDNLEAHAIDGELVELGRAEAIELGGRCCYRLSREALAAHRQRVQQRADEADLN